MNNLPRTVLGKSEQKVTRMEGRPALGALWFHPKGADADWSSWEVERLGWELGSCGDPSLKLRVLTNVDRSPLSPHAHLCLTS